ncbi:YjbR protein [Amycolatopsis marina]|uniref:YjbR protein n=1 Tax=Amycolatopsis marina TaxID=490629 RepID=A0A1I1B6K1_9PSEU|nr:MmcQ/YjbR family DNA-binding protein [Amycolatopsis marina]SFB44338.1 YjbR protein [Amycolatopsis marina]
MSDSADVPSETVARLRSVCLGMPETYEEPAWVGVRWRIRQQTFAHVLTIECGRPQAYALAAGTEGPATVLTFRSSGPELDALSVAGHPFFRPRWGPTVVGMMLDADSDWEEITELLTESYCQQAPKKLARLIDRPALS